MYEKDDVPFGLDYLADISDPEIRARTLRQAGGLVCDDDGCSVYLPIVGGGYEAQLHAATHGQDEATSVAALFAGAEGLRAAIDLQMPPKWSGSFEVVMTAEEPGIELKELAPGFGAVTWRRSNVNMDEAGCLYNAGSFLVWRYGECFNTFVTITPWLMGLIDQRVFADLMPAWNKEMKRWLAVDNTRFRQRWAKRVRAAAPQEHRYVFVYEHGREMGLHAHQLCIVPSKQVEAFRTHTKDWWERAVGRPIPDAAVKVQVTNKYGLFGYKWHFEKLRYLWKSLQRFESDGTMIGRADTDGQFWTAEEIFKPFVRRRTTAGVIVHGGWKTRDVYVGKLYGISRSLDEAAQKLGAVEGGQRVPFRSALARKHFDEMFQGREIADYDRRVLLNSLSV